MSNITEGNGYTIITNTGGASINGLTMPPMPKAKSSEGSKGMTLPPTPHSKKK